MSKASGFTIFYSIRGPTHIHFALRNIRGPPYDASGATDKAMLKTLQIENAKVSRKAKLQCFWHKTKDGTIAE